MNIDNLLVPGQRKISLEQIVKMWVYSQLRAELSTAGWAINGNRSALQQTQNLYVTRNTHTSVEGSPHLASRQSNYSSLKVPHKTLHSVICNSNIQMQS